MYSNPPNTEPSGFRMVIPRTQFVSGFRIASLDRFIVKKIFYSCQNGLGQRTIRNPDEKIRFSNGEKQNGRLSLDRFINKGHKKYFIHAKTVQAINRTNGRDRHNIQSENRPRFGIRMPTVFHFRISPFFEWRFIQALNTTHFCQVIFNLENALLVGSFHLVAKFSYLN